MKNRIYNGNALEFFNSDNSKKGEIKISGSDIIINPLDSNGTVIFGEEGTINDIEVGAAGTPVDFTFLGGGTITSNGGTLTLGNAGDTVDLSNATIGTITASIFQGGEFIGDGSGLTGVTTDLSAYTGSVNISGAVDITGPITGSTLNLEGIVNAGTDTDKFLVLDSDGNVDFRTGENVLSDIGGQASGNYVTDEGGAAGQVGVWSSATGMSGSNDLFFDIANNRLGIGTASPAQKLEVEGNIYTGGSVRIKDSGDQLEFGNANVALQRTSNLLELGGYDGIVFKSSNTVLDSQSERMRITSAGNVGIGTTSSLDKLHVEGGDIRIRGASSTSDLILDHNNTYSGSRIRGIRDTGPDTQDFGSSALQFLTNDNSTTSAEVQMTLSSEGKLQIGSGFAPEKLTVEGNVSASGNFLGVTGSLEALKLSGVVNAGTDTDKFLVLDSSGNVDFRTGANVLSDIGAQGSGNYVTDAGGVACQVAVWSSGTAISGSNSLFFDTANNRLGIGTPSPSQPLHVVGNGLLTGNLTVEGNVTAQEFHTEFVSASIIYESGSTQFGDSIDDSHTFTGSLLLSGSTCLTGDLFLGDNRKVVLGSGTDMLLYHNGTDSVIDNNTGDLYITNKADNKDIIFRSDDGSSGFTPYFRLDGSNERLIVEAPNGMLFYDNKKAKFGNGSDLEIYHTGAHSFITAQSGTGSLYIRPGNGNTVQIEDKDSNDMITAAPTGVRLLYNSSEKLTTTNTGISVTGNISASGDITGFTGSYHALNLSDVVNAGTDTDKFLVLDSSGNVDFRTGANVLSDIGGQASGNYVTDAGGAACQVGVWSSATDMSGSNSLFFNTAKNTLGIGTSSPYSTTTLHITSGSQVGGTNMVIENGYGESCKTIKFNHTTNTIASIATYGRVTTSGAGPALIFNLYDKPNTTLAEVARFTTSGSLGIGITTPAEKLTVEGNISGSGGLRVGSGTFSGAIDTCTDAAIVIPENKAIYTLESDGNYLRNLIKKSNDIIQIGQSGTALITQIRLMPGNAGFTSFYNETTEVARVTGSCVGIGTTSPGEILEVVGNISASGKVMTTEIEGSSITLDSAGDITLDADGADVILKDGGTEFGRFKRDNSDFVIKSATQDKDIVFRGNDGGSTITAMTVDMSEGGKVGIGTTTPAEKLTVEGNISASGLTTTNTLTVTGLSNQASEATALMINGSNIVGTRELGSNAFSSTTFVQDGGGAACQVAIWADGSRISGSNDLFYNTSNGRLGIGTNSPSHLLHVDGTATIGTNSSVNNSLRILGSVTASVNGTDVMLHLNDEDMGLSTMFRSDQYGNSQDLIFKKNSQGNERFGLTATFDGTAANDTIILGYQACRIHIGTANYGNVGVGIDNTVNPPEKLTVGGNISGSGCIRIGNQHTLSGSFSSIAGGVLNAISDNCSTIAGGDTNTINGRSSFIGAGNNNTTNCSFAFIGAGRDNVASNDTGIVAGRSNSLFLTSRCSVIGGGESNKISGSSGDVADSSFIGAGSINCINGGLESFIGSGCKNCITGDRSVIVGGTLNTGSGACGFIGGGEKNYLQAGTYSAIVGGCNNVINGLRCNFIGGGYSNCINGSTSQLGNTITGGGQNIINGSVVSFSTIGGGNLNCLADNHSMTIAGGSTNTIKASCGFIGGGGCNCIDNSAAIATTIVGGLQNTGSGACSFIGGGQKNNICTGEVLNFIGGGFCNTVDSDCSVIVGGCNNCITGAGNIAFIGGGFNNTVTNALSSGHIIVGGSNNISCNTTTGGGYTVVVGGQCNAALGVHAIVVAGCKNTGSGNYAFVGGGNQNCVTGGQSIIVGGSQNKNLTGCGVLVGGEGNCIASYTGYEVIVGGQSNTVTGDSEQSSIVGGQSNCINDSTQSFIGNGNLNFIEDGNGSVIVGGCNNKLHNQPSEGFIGAGCRILAQGHATVIVGGHHNTGSGNYTFMGGGCTNCATGAYDIIIGGLCNRALGNCGFIGGGCCNTICSAETFAFVGGGCRNRVDGDYSVTVGGRDNCNDQACAFVGGGFSNYNAGFAGVLGGGYNNTICNETYVGIVGGRNNVADSDYTFIGGGCNNIVCSNCSVIVGGNNNCINATCHKNFIGGGEANDILGLKGCHTIGGGSVNIINTNGNKNTIAGGGGNCITCCVENSTIGGGAANRICRTTAADYGSVIGGGAENCIIGDGCFTSILGGYRNRACDRHATIGGGCTNIIQTGNCSAILGGKLNHISHDNAMVIGSNLSSSAACYTFMNNACVAGVTRTAFLVETSAKKYKECILPLDDQLENISKLEPVEFQWKRDRSKDIGFIAEDVEHIYPNLIAYEEDGEINGIQYSKLTTVLVKGLQEQQAQIDQLKEEIKLLKQNR